MTERDRKLMIGVAVIVLLGGFWLLVLSPKRAAVGTAVAERDAALSQLETARSAAASGAKEKKRFKVSYAQLVKLGKAIPAKSDLVSMIVQLNDSADQAGVSFTSLQEAAATGAATEGPSGATGGINTLCEAGGGPSGTTGATGSTPQSFVGKDKQAAENGVAAANGDANRASGTTTDASSGGCAATPTATDLAAVASGLKLDTLSLEFRGNFFNLHDFFDNMYHLVRNRNGKISSTGRLLQISKITMEVDKFPILKASVTMTAYRLPGTISPTAGATPAGPAPTTAPASAPASSSTPPAAITGVH
ncbi:MAG: hypothetical protein JHC87_00555 [Thermoleophilaceae bacterium]|nr:hypothetical protein [Thermoleophilaceae bacterium]